ncbi:unnamed protein product [Lupinus luteus]|uniref:PdxS/SNZ N-terminal domain-containing protein n=1 Tax=Lupinus luteus TaxID=3873 RepID=A0AAV1XWP0_LUPLU
MVEDGTVTLYNITHITNPNQKPFSFKVGLSQTLCEGTIFEVSNLQQAKIAEEAGARAIKVSHPITRHEGSGNIVARARVRKFVEALRRIREGASMIRTQGDLEGSGNIVETMKNVRSMMGDIRVLSSMDEDEVFAFSKKIEAPYDLVVQTKQLGRLHVVNFAVGVL